MILSHPITVHTLWYSGYSNPSELCGLVSIGSQDIQYGPVGDMDVEIFK